MALQTSVETKAAALNAQLALLDGGEIRIYSGSQPAATNTALGAQVLLSQHALSATAFATTATATATANAIAADDSAAASGTASFYRAFDDGGVCHRQGSVGESGSGAELIIDNADIVENGVVTISSYSVTQG